MARTGNYVSEVELVIVYMRSLCRCRIPVDRTVEGAISELFQPPVKKAVRASLVAA